MNFEITLEIILSIIQLMAIAVVIYASIRLKVKAQGLLFKTFFIFGMISLALEDVYWIAYDLLRGGQRMPFAGNEIADCAAVLLLTSALALLLPRREEVQTSALTMKLRKSRAVSFKSIVITLAFMLPSIALWIAWSGQWVENIVFGIPYMYFLYVILLSNRQHDVLRRSEEIAIASVCAVIIILDYVSLIARDSASFIDPINYVIMNLLTLYLLIRCIISLRSDVSGLKTLILSFVLFFYTGNVMFMCDGLIYDLALLLNILSIPVMYLSVKKEYADDAC